ncbi:MAG: hypothetical protein KME18_17135 [Phormidium tanganyikae FI6-MK23]|nr:hypothetical protein [Phormidium tanganyikae FI6-MK23]
MEKRECRSPSISWLSVRSRFYPAYNAGIICAYHLPNDHLRHPSRSHHQNHPTPRSCEGEEIVISQDGQAIDHIPSTNRDRTPRTPGQHADKLTIPDNFNDPLPDDILDSFLNPADPEPRMRAYSDIVTI